MYINPWHHQWCIQEKYAPVYITGLHIAQYFRGAHNSWKTGPFRLHDSLYDTHSTCRHTPAVFWTARGVCGEWAPVVYISGCIYQCIYDRYAHRWCVHQGMAFPYLIRTKRVSNCYMQEKKNWQCVCLSWCSVNILVLVLGRQIVYGQNTVYLCLSKYIVF